MSARACRLVVLALLVPGSAAAAQSVRVSGATSLRYIELRPFVRDSVPEAVAAGDGLLRQLADGRIVRCVPGDPYCQDVRPGEVVSTVPVIHDVTVSAWGLGRGLRLQSQLRGRTSFGAEPALWPREDDHLEVLSLFGEIERGDWRVRAGRQWRVSGLGYYNFDGLAVALRPRPAAWVEIYGGRSLVRGLNDGRAGGALESIEALSTPNAGVLVGAQARYRPAPRLQLGAVYQLDLRGDRHGVYSELAAADATLRVGQGALEGSVELDLAGHALNHARLSARSAPVGNAALFAEARRYRPYFELWTIWGAFAPVGFDEAKGGITWAARDGRFIARGEASYRRYGDTGADAPNEFRASGWGAGGTLSWSPTPGWRVDGGYRLESGFGAARWDGQAGLRRALGADGWVALQGVGFQRLYEFRLGEGTVYGLGGEGAFRIGERARVFASLMAYRQHGGAPATVDWNQRRASVRLEWVLGGEPAESTPPAGARR